MLGLQYIPGHKLSKRSMPYTKKNIELGVEKPYNFYSERQIFEAGYEGENALLKFVDPQGFITDLGNGNHFKEQIHFLIKEMMRKTPTIVEVFKDQYGIDLSSESYLVGVTPDELKRRGMTEDEINSFMEVRRLYFVTLIEAYEQMLCLIYNNKLLREMVSSSIHNTYNLAKLESFKTRMSESGLRIVEENHNNGFRGRKGNHGSLFEEDGQIVLHLDREASTDIQELIHEYSAYLLIKLGRSQNKNIIIDALYTGEKRLADDKQKFLGYILVFIDFLGSGGKHITDYLNI